MTHMERIAAPVDDIVIFLGPLPEVEHKARQRIRTCRNAAAYKLVQTDSQHARDLCNLVTETATYWIYRHASVETLEKAVAYMVGLLKLVDQVEELRVLA